MTLLAPERRDTRTDTGTDVETEFVRIIDQLTRRGLLAGGVGSATLLGLAACGASDPSASSTPSVPSTRTVQTAKGSVRVPADPKRVVSIQPAATATLYDLGLASIGVYDQGSEYISPRYRAKWDAATKVGTAGAIDVEKVATLNPDLIIGLDYEWNTNVYSKLTALAPTVIAPATSWQGTAAIVADAVNRTDQLDALKTRLVTRSAEIKKAYATQLAAYTWDILQGGFTAGQFWVYGPRTDPGRVLADAGVRFAGATTAATASKDPGAGILAVSYEQIGKLDDAGVIGFYADYDDKPNNKGPQLFAQKLWKQLPAVKAGRLVPFPDLLVGGYGDALAVLDELEAGLKKLQG
ncbi:iron siderophore-binding protein [Microlunatus endophyticus]|uniref:Iron siderophore-binding protein n=1 Tax=Microlunatus endophyticus TaxID=1716077 RepID=A0A917SDP7_9ACTN|nr:ABC transporter substrate-binding protein [Microlunatus endophyticus]GGL72818.1 iron siderophore-binding protein [Microlunatus endophyticus]